MKFRSLLGGAIVGLRDYFVAEEIVTPKGLRGGSPQIDGWPPTVDAEFYVMPRWMKLWIIVAPLLVLLGVALCAQRIAARLADVSVQIVQHGGK